MYDIFYKSLSEGKTINEINYLVLTSEKSKFIRENQVMNTNENYENKMKSCDDTETSDHIMTEVIEFDDHLDEMLNEEECVKKIQEQKKKEELCHLQELKQLPKPISISSLFHMNYLMDSYKKREMFLNRVSKISKHFSETSDISNESMFELLNQQPLFNNLIKDVFVKQESLSIYETYFYDFLLPFAFGIKTSHKLTYKIPFANYILNFCKKHLGSYTADVAVKLTNTIRSTNGENKMMTLKSLMVLCSKGSIFKDYNAIKDLAQSNFLTTFEYEILDIESNDLKIIIGTYIKNVLKYAYYAILLTCFNEYYKKKYS